MNNFKLTWPIEGKEDWSIEVFSPYDKEMTKTQVAEIFIEEDYKDGLDYIKTKKDAVVVDLGGCMGMAALYFKDHAKTIYSIEPSSIPFKCLIENTKAYPNIKPLKYAIMHQNRPIDIFTNDTGPVPDSIFGNGKIRETTQAKTFDKFMEEQGIEHIDLLKIDCEGAEYMILPSSGFEKVADKIDMIVGEGHFFGEARPDYIPEMLKDYGFKVEFLPKKNMFKVLTYKDGETGKEKEYKLWFNTIFKATK